jgi:membrane-associated protein
MHYPRFLSFDVFGAAGWVFSMTILGFSLGKVDLVRRNFEKFVLLIIFVSLLPVITHAVRAGLQRKAVAER